MKGAIRYRVTVEAVVEREELASGAWVDLKIGDDGKPVKGYAPDRMRVIAKDVKVFEQSVDTLDIATLVSVINGIKGGQPCTHPTPSPCTSC